MVAESIARWRLTVWGFGLLALFVVTGCTPSTRAASERGTAVVVFVDFSGSITGADQASFRQELEGDILPSLSEGDRLIIAPINDKTLTDFRPLVDATLPAKPKFNGFLDNVLKHNKKTKEIDDQVLRLKDKTRREVANIFAKRYAAPKTDIFSSLLLAEKLFHNEPRRKVLVLMSDMIEDTPPYDFERISWNPATIQKTLAELDAKGLIPRLSGICVYVSGASAKSADLAENISRFWLAYFRRAGADMDPSRYAHVLLQWPPSDTCHSVSPRRAI